MDQLLDKRRSRLFSEFAKDYWLPFLPFAILIYPLYFISISLSHRQLSSSEVGIYLLITYTFGDSFVTYFGVLADLEREGNPIMRSLFYQWGIIPTLVCKIIVSLWIISFLYRTIQIASFLPKEHHRYKFFQCLPDILVASGFYTCCISIHTWHLVFFMENVDGNPKVIPCMLITTSLALLFGMIFNRRWGIASYFMGFTIHGVYLGYLTVLMHQRPEFFPV